MSQKSPKRIKKLQFLAISSLLYVSQKLPGITFWLFLLFFGQNLKKTPVPDNFQLSRYKLKSPGASYILKVQPLPGNSMLTYSKLGIARNLLHFWKQSGTTFIFDTSFWLFPAHRNLGRLTWKKPRVFWYPNNHPTETRFFSARTPHYTSAI